MAHLMRRAGFGATRDELEDHVAMGYEATVEELLHPRERGNMPDEVICWQSAQVGQIRTREDYYYEELRGSSLMVLL